MAILKHILSLEQLRLENERVFVRADLDERVDPVGDQVADDGRIRAVLPTLRHVVDAGGRVVLAAHRGDPGGKEVMSLSLEPVGMRLAELSGWEVLLPDSCVGDAVRKVIADLRAGQICLLENLRFHSGEQQNDEAFARQLALLCDVYVNDALSLAADAHASLQALPRLIPRRACGLRMKLEVEAVEQFCSESRRPRVAIVGGATWLEKIDLLQALAQRCDTICVGGAIANTLLAAQGHELGLTPVEQRALAQARTLLSALSGRGPELVLPRDLVVARPSGAAHAAVPVDRVAADESVVDLGPQSTETLERCIRRAGAVFWNGPLGWVEQATATTASAAIANAISRVPGLVGVVMGSRTEQLLQAADCEVWNGAGLVSVTRSAVLATLQGQRLPALETLRGGQP